MRSENETKALIAKIERGLKTAGLTVDEFCVRATINRATWQRWKSEKHSPHPSMLAGIEAHFAAIMADSQATKSPSEAA